MDIDALLNSEGPVVKVVVLRTDGSVEEQIVDMSPSKHPMENVLGGPITLNGQYMSELVVMVVRQRHRVRNVHVLPPPFHKDVIHGDVCLVRMDENAVPRDYTRQEYIRLRQGYFVTRNSIFQRVRSRSI
jgi:hypothetical protein